MEFGPWNLEVPLLRSGGFPIPLWRLRDQAFFDGAGGHAHVTDFATGQEGFDTLQVGHEFPLGDGGDVGADTAGFLRFTGAPDNAALHRAFASEFTNACHKSNLELKRSKNSRFCRTSKFFRHEFHELSRSRFAISGGTYNTDETYRTDGGLRGGCGERDFYARR